MEKIRERMMRAGVWNVMAGVELDAFWKYGVAAVTDAALRETLARFLEGPVPVQFFSAPASPSGKHHPSWQNAPFGMLRNTTECCLMVPAMAAYVPGMLDAEKRPRPDLVDVALAATVVSDTFKVGPDGRKTGADHGRVAGAAWRAFARTLGIVPEETVEKVGAASDWHYGIWTPGYADGQALAPETWLVHLIDAFFAQNALERLYHPRGAIE